MRALNGPKEVRHEDGHVRLCVEHGKEFLGGVVEELDNLIFEAQRGDLDAFGELVRRFGDMAHGYACSRLGDFQLAEDATQEVFIEVYRSLGQLREPTAFAGWLRRIVVKHCDRQTRRKRRPEVPLEAASGTRSTRPDPLKAAEKGELRERILEVVAALPEAERAATTLFYINGYSQEEIAGFLETSADTVKNRLRSSRKRLKERMFDLAADAIKNCALPGNFAELVVRKVSSPQDLEGAARILAPTYHGKRESESLQSLDAARKHNVYVVEEKGQTVSAGWLDETEMGIGSTIVKAVRPREFAGESEGVPDPIFVRSVSGAFRLAREKGISLACVHGSMYDHAFCGFVPCFHYAVGTLACEEAHRIDARARIREASRAEAKAGRLAFLRDPFVPKMSAFIGGGVPHVVEHDGRIIGHLRVNRDFRVAEHYGMHFGYVTDLALDDEHAVLAVLKLAAELAAGDGQREVCLPYSDRTAVVRAIKRLGGSYDLKGSCPLPGLDAEMVAILDLVGLSRELEAEFAARASGKEPAAFSIEAGAEVVGFSLQKDRLAIGDGKQEVHRAIPHWLATRLYMGYCSGEELLSMGPIPWDRSDGRTPDRPDLDMRPFELPKPEAQLFRALFPKMWPTSTPDPDVWPWVIGKDGPLYQGEDRKTPEMKKAIDRLRFPWLER